MHTKQYILKYYIYLIIKANLFPSVKIFSFTYNTLLKKKFLSTYFRNILQSFAPLFTKCKIANLRIRIIVFFQERWKKIYNRQCDDEIYLWLKIKFQATHAFGWKRKFRRYTLMHHKIKKALSLRIWCAYREGVKCLEWVSARCGICRTFPTTLYSKVRVSILLPIRLSTTCMMLNT